MLPPALAALPQIRRSWRRGSRTPLSLARLYADSAVSGPTRPGDRNGDNGYGGGAIIAAPLNEYLIKTFYDAPDCLGTSATVPLVTEHGRQFAEVGGALAEVVVVGAAGIANIIVPGV